MTAVPVNIACTSENSDQNGLNLSKKTDEMNSNNSSSATKLAASHSIDAILGLRVAAAAAVVASQAAAHQQLHLSYQTSLAQGNISIYIEN